MKDKFNVLWNKIRTAAHAMDRYSIFCIGRFPWLFCIIGIAIIIMEVFSLLAFEEKTNRVAEKAIDIDMFAMGNVDGNQSRACISVNMDYWGIDSIPNNHITIRHIPQINFPNDTVANILKKALKSYNINANMVHGIYSRFGIIHLCYKV